MEYRFLTDKLISKINYYLDKYPKKEQAIIPSLHEILYEYRDIPFEAVEELANYLNIPISHIEGIVSFYDMFRHPKQGAKNHIRICRNLPCHLARYKDLLKMFEELTGARAGDISPDKLWYIELVECIGSCSIAPAFLINDDLYDGSKIKSVDDLKAILDRYK